MKEVERMMFVQLTGGWPAQFLPHVRYMVKLTAAGDNTQGKVHDFFEALHVLFGSVSKNRETVSDVRENQGVDQCR